MRRAPSSLAIPLTFCCVVTSRCHFTEETAVGLGTVWKIHTLSVALHSCVRVKWEGRRPSSRRNGVILCAIGAHWQHKGTWRGLVGKGPTGPRPVQERGQMDQAVPGIRVGQKPGG